MPIAVDLDKCLTGEMGMALELGQPQKVYSNMHSTTHLQTPSPETKVHTWLLACSAGLVFWVAAGSFLLALVW